MMKKILNLLIVAGIAALGLTVSSCQKDTKDTPGKQTPAKYTLMIYGCGGGNVDGQLEYVLEDLQKELSTDRNQVGVTVMYSMSASDKEFSADFRGKKGTTYRYVLDKNTDLTRTGYQQYKYKDASQVKLNSAATLAEFIQWTKENAPAENYILMPMNHGGGFDLGTELLTKGAVYDDNNEEKGVAIVTFAEALKQTNTKLKALYWYDCLMGQLEVLTEMAPYCEYQFASTHVARVNNDHVMGIVKALNDYPADFEKAIGAQKTYLETQFYIAFKNVPDDHQKDVYHNENCDFACWRSDKIAAINEQVKKFGEFMASTYPKHPMDLDVATSWVYLFEKDCPHADLLDYADNVAEFMTDATLKAQAGTIAEDLKKAIDAALVYRMNGVHLKSGDGKSICPKRGSYSVGISIYAGQGEDVDLTYTMMKSRYKDSAFDKATGWSKWLDINETRVITDATHPNLNNPCNDSSWELFWLD